MAASTYLGLVPKDDPMFSGGPQIFSRHESNESTKSSAKSTDGAKDTKLQNPPHLKEPSSHPRPMDEQEMFDQAHEHLTGEERAMMAIRAIKASTEKAKTNPQVLSEEKEEGEERLSNAMFANRHKRFNQKP